MILSRKLSGYLLVLLLFCVSLPPLAAAEKPANSRQFASFNGPITAEQVEPHVRFLADPRLEGRGNEQSKRLARDYLIKQYADCGLKPLFSDGSYLQPIPGSTTADGQPTVRGYNVGAWLPGSDPQLRDEFVIISAHYDHLGVRRGKVYPGADDNASSMAMVLETARQFTSAAQPPRRSIVFLNFDLEENMLWGSRWFASHPPWPLERVKLFITADLLGRSLGDLPLRSVFVIGSELAPNLRDHMQQVGQPDGLKVHRLGVDLIGTRSDYGPFHDRQIPFLFFSTGEHPDYHTPRDTADRIDYKQLARISSLVFRISQSVANGDEPPHWTSQTTPDLEEVKSLYEITSKILAAEEEGTLQMGSVQKFFVSNIHTKFGSIIERGELRSGERPWLIRSAQFLLLTVF
tara:strand:- start:1296 stop:2510 length:1215 start_codon:yes stop_codon:yes gene_type:complete